MSNLDFTNCGHQVIMCPNGEGSPFECHSFCSLCEGFGEYCETCGGKPIDPFNCNEEHRIVIDCPDNHGQHKAIKCLDCGNILEKDCEVVNV